MLNIHVERVFLFKIISDCHKFKIVIYNAGRVDVIRFSTRNARQFYINLKINLVKKEVLTLVFRA